MENSEFNNIKINNKIINNFYFKKFNIKNKKYKIIIFFISLTPKVIFEVIIKLKNRYKIDDYVKEKNISKKNKTEGFDRLI